MSAPALLRDCCLRARNRSVRPHYRFAPAAPRRRDRAQPDVEHAHADFAPTVSVLEVYHFGTQHFDHHRLQLTLPEA